MVQDLLNNLQKYFNQSLIVIGKSDYLSDYLFQIKPLFGNRYGFPGRLPLPRIRERFQQADIVLIHGFFLFSTLMAVSLSKTQKIFLMPHGSLETYQDKNSRFLKLIFIWVFNSLLNGRKIHFLVCSIDEISSVKAKFPNAEISVVKLGINTIEIIESNNMLETQIQSKVKLLSLSRIARKKRIDLTIRTLHSLRELGINADLYIAGDGEAKLINELKNLVSHLALDQSVFWLGNLSGSKKSQILGDAHIFLLPSENENFAIAVAESISANLPVIVSSNVAMSRFVKEFKTGEVVESLEVEEIVSCALRILDNREFYALNCENSKFQLTWEYVLEDWISVLTGEGA